MTDQLHHLDEGKLAKTIWWIKHGVQELCDVFFISRIINQTIPKAYLSFFILLYNKQTNVFRVLRIIGRLSIESKWS